MQPLPVAATPPAVSTGLKVGICAISFFVPLLGLIMGIIYWRNANPAKKSAGKLWTIFGIAMTVFWVLVRLGMDS